MWFWSNQKFLDGSYNTISIKEKNWRIKQWSKFNTSVHQNIPLRKRIGKPQIGLPRWCCGKELTCQCRRCRKFGFNPWVGKIPWSRKWQSTPVLLSWKLHGQRSLAGYSPWCLKELEATEHAYTSHRLGKDTYKIWI